MKLRQRSESDAGKWLWDVGIPSSAPKLRSVEIARMWNQTNWCKKGPGQAMSMAISIATGLGIN